STTLPDLHSFPTRRSSDLDLTSADILESSADKEGASTTATPSAASTAPPEPKQGEEWTTAGGWYRSQGGFTLFYRPSGHADAFLDRKSTRLNSSHLGISYA